MMRALLCAALLLLCASPARAAGMRPAEIEAFTARFQKAWNEIDPAQLEALFDTSWTQPLYQAEESRTLFEDWTAIRAYWKFCRDYIQRVELTVTETPRAVEIAPGVTLLSYRFHLDSELKLYAPMGFKPLGMDVRVTAIAHATPQGPKLIAYFEGAPGPMALMRQLLETQVRPGYGR